ncbi:MAG: response regulator [Streptosporangiaceae bacterium]
MRQPGTMSVRCLIVDDNRDFLRAASDLLERTGITVVGVASTGAQAGRACGELQPDVVLLDVDLGEESGFEVARQLAGLAGPDQPRVILISAYAAEDFGDMMADTPAVSFLPKGTLSGQAVLAIVRGGPPAARA